MPSRKSGIALLLLLCALARAAQAKENAMLEWLRSADTLSKEHAAALEGVWHRDNWNNAATLSGHDVDEEVKKWEGYDPELAADVQNNIFARTVTLVILNVNPKTGVFYGYSWWNATGAKETSQPQDVSRLLGVARPILGAEGVNTDTLVIKWTTNGNLMVEGFAFKYENGTDALYVNSYATNELGYGSRDNPEWLWTHRTGAWEYMKSDDKIDDWLPIIQQELPLHEKLLAADAVMADT